MLGLYITLGVLGVIAITYVILVAPGKKKDIAKYKNVKYAHRGLHGGERAENSMSAFRAAVEAGYGIELDIRLSSDGQLVVFHDDTLNRVAGVNGRVDAFSAEELSKMSLSGTADGVPLFSDVLEMVDGRVPLLVEIKEATGKYGVSNAAAQMLANYNGPYIVESFNPLSIRNFSKKNPTPACGILSHRYFEQKKYRKPLFLALQLLLFNRVCKPSFIAYDHNHASSISLKVARLLGAATIAWTVRSPEEAERAYKNGFDGIIFENFEA